MSPAARRRLVTIAVLSLLLDCIRVGLERIPVPYEAVYRALLFMFYPVAGLGQGLTEWAGLALSAACVLVPVALGAAALSPWPVPRALLCQLRRWALALPILYFITSDLSRWVMNGVYAGSRWASADLTPAIERVEAPLVEAVQDLGGPVLTRVLATGYSTVWILALLAAPLLFLAAGPPPAARRLLIAYFLAPVLAVPSFLLLPVFEPWAMNPLYGYTGPGMTEVRFMSPSPLGALQLVAGPYRWATGACLPSLHVVFPAVVSLVAAQHGARGLSRGYAAFAAVTGFSIVYLGRHWVTDIVAALPFTVGLVWVAGRVDERLAAARFMTLLRE